MAEVPFDFTPKIRIPTDEILDAVRKSGLGPGIMNAIQQFGQGQDRGQAQADRQRMLAQQMAQKKAQEQMAALLGGGGQPQQGQQPPMAGMGGQMTAQPQQPQMPGANPLLGTMAKIDPKAAFDAYQQQQGDTQKLQIGQQEKAAALAEKTEADKSNEQVKTLMAETNRLIAMGQHEASMAKIDELRSALEERKKQSLRDIRLKAQKANQGAIFPWSKKVTVPPDPDAWTDADEKRMKELQAMK